ncbi:MAG: 2'-5' RNA ligase family protein [Spirochaetales bacterium]|nr:2'-5' RNA ligase family protein [Spirochaetales bacterium]
MNRGFFPEQTHFIGVLLPDDLTQKLLKCREYMNHKYGCRSGFGTPIHVTLVPPFKLPAPCTTADIAAALAQMVAEKKWHAFNAKIEGFDAFGDRTLFAKVLPSAVWTAFRAAVCSAVAQASPGAVRKDTRPFQPHATVANRDIPPGASTEALEYLNQLELAATFPVDNITIFERREKRWTATQQVEL